MFRIGGPFDRYDPYDCCSHRGFCRCTNGGLLALIELIEDGLVENERNGLCGISCLSDDAGTS
eukprot:scaffold28457_cov154-Skeletonema_dohrnii-CCMP3373.AAC.1